MIDKELLKKIDLHMAYQSEKNKQDMHESLVKIVGDALGENPTRYIDVSRIPLICKSIIDISESMKELKSIMVNKEVVESNTNRITAIESNLSWGVKIILGAVILSVLGLILIK